MDRIITLPNGGELRLRATALTPRLYRFKLGRDMIVDLNALKKSYEKAGKAQDAQLTVTDLTIFENVAYIMAKQYDSTLPDTPEEWLDGLDGLFTVYEVLPDILELWQLNQHTTSIPKKK